MLSICTKIYQMCLVIGPIELLIYVTVKWNSFCNSSQKLLYKKKVHGRKTYTPIRCTAFTWNIVWCEVYLKQSKVNNLWLFSVIPVIWYYLFFCISYFAFAFCWSSISLYTQNLQYRNPLPFVRVMFLTYTDW